MKLSLLQEHIINSNEKKMVIISSAASGKTRVITEKVRKILKESSQPGRIVVITFTNLAAVELIERLGSDYKSEMFIGTIHSYANYLLLLYGYYTGNIIENEEYDKLFYEVEHHKEVIQPVDYLFLDEAQDTNEKQYNFIFNLVKPKNYFIVMDPKQTIYQFNGSNPNLFDNIIDSPLVSVVSLNENYRNDHAVLSFAKRIINRTGYIDDSICMTGKTGKVEQVIEDLQLMALALKQSGDFKDWAILCRFNTKIAEVLKVLNDFEVPYVSFDNEEKFSRDELAEKLNQNAVKVMSIHKSKGKEFDNVIVIGAKFFSIEERNVAYVAATRARHKLIWVVGKKKNEPTPKYKKKKEYETWE